ncbi:hypothetical protein AGR1A_Cc50460 [Agrobacterium fabacearum CFBP 5771]|nr:hypothetical protein AGR1A_Cc50460 [Agrobacterium fabacearum CFBP 5771]
MRIASCLPQRRLPRDRSVAEVVLRKGRLAFSDAPAFFAFGEEVHDTSDNRAPRPAAARHHG